MSERLVPDECEWCRRFEPCDCGENQCKCECGQCLAPYVYPDGVVEVHEKAIRVARHSLPTSTQPDQGEKT